MKKLLLQFLIIFCVSTLSAQWIQVNNGLPDFAPTAMCAWDDTIVVSTYGGGLFKTNDSGENWFAMPGVLPNLFVNNIVYSGGQFDPISVSTDGGPFICVNGAYIDCNGNGLTNNKVHWWSDGYGGIVVDAVAGTHGDGVFAAEYTSPFIYDWAPANPGLTGDALFVNDGLVGDGMALLATDGGFFQALGDETEWTAKNNGLSGDALKINDICWLGVTLIATDGGLYYTADAESWSVVLPDVKFNVAYYVNTDISPSGYMFFALGESGFSTEDFITWTEMDFGGMEGEVTAAVADSANVYIGFTTTKKSGRGNGGIYKRPIEQFLLGINNNLGFSPNIQLHQNFPNPFTKRTKIDYFLENSGFVCLEVFDIYGKKVQSLVNSQQEIGLHSIEFKSGDLPEGIYLFRLQMESEFSMTRKMVIQK
jgi:Secretion system C-terminal sorting domain